MNASGGRGSTTVSDRALVKIAEQIAAEDDRLAGRPHASASVSGSIAAVHLDLAVRYPSPVPRLAADLRARLRRRLRELTGLSAENIDIEVVRLPGPASVPRRVPVSGPTTGPENHHAEGGAQAPSAQAPSPAVTPSTEGGVQTPSAQAPSAQAPSPAVTPSTEGGVQTPSAQAPSAQAPSPAVTPSTGTGRLGGMLPRVGRPGRRSAKRAFRPTRVIPATVAAIVLLAAGVLTAVHVVSALTGRPVRLVPYETVLGWARATTWNDGWVLAAAGALVLLGALLLLPAVVPGRGRLLALRTADPDLVVGMSRHALARRLRHVAGAVDGVRQARVRVSGRRARVRAWTDLRGTAAVTERVRAAVERELARLSPVHRMSVDVRVGGPS